MALFVIKKDGLFYGHQAEDWQDPTFSGGGMTNSNTWQTIGVYINGPEFRTGLFTTDILYRLNIYEEVEARKAMEETAADEMVDIATLFHYLDK